ncbi:MAG: CPBP family intramembrane glutamic endopeptidase [Rhodoglobus sp.]
MLDPEWAITRALLWLALVAMVGLLVLRAVRRDRREYQRFKRYRSTKRRQAMYRKWLRDSFLSFGAAAVVLAVLAGAFIAPLLAATSAWPPVAAVRDWVAANPVLAVVVGLVAVAAFAALTVIGVTAARQEGEVPTIGDIHAMLPRNRPELGLGALLSVNAGIVEELVFRLGLPALLFGATGSALAAVFGSVLLFGALHAYQGVAGVVGTTLIGAVFMAAYLLSGSILVPIALHALFDVRSMVVIPMAVNGAHRVPAVSPPRS